MTNVKTHDDIVTKYCIACKEPYYEHGIAKIKLKHCLFCGVDTGQVASAAANHVMMKYTTASQREAMEGLRRKE